MKIGEFSRRGAARGQKAVRASDHDMHPDAVLTPAGILEVDSNLLNVVFGTSRDTSDFVADCLELWWSNRRMAYPGVRRLLINLDNGPEIASSRTQFMKRLVEFSDLHQLTLELAYYPPYHGKYNPAERCWGILENHWNGALLTSIETTLEWAKTMTWRGVAPTVCLLDRVYQTGRPSLIPPLPSHRRPPRTFRFASEVEPLNPTYVWADYFLRVTLLLLEGLGYP